ncbi:MAG: hypothetical protein U5L45_16610 [Saprospiraceae bacterium]|nr:hypothetical protein [Saprospiraceae bacterium]
MGSGFIMHVEKGDFAGHPASLKWADRPESTVKMRTNMIYSKVDPRDLPTKKPQFVEDDSTTTIYEMGKKYYPDMGIKPPSVWLPHGVLGVSTSELITDDTKGSFGPFAGQVFVGDQGISKIARVFLEKVNGQYQGASFDFRSGFRSGVLRMCMPLLHPQAFYTLNAIPQGAKADIKLVDAVFKHVQVVDKGTLANTPDNQMKEAMPSAGSVESVGKKGKSVEKWAEKAKKKVVETPKPVVVAPKPAESVVNEKEIQGLLGKYTCNACHKTNDRTVGPSFAEIAKRKYTVSKMAQFIAVPQPQNWPDFETPMPPMPHVPKKDVEKMAAWINSLRK